MLSGGAAVAVCLLLAIGAPVRAAEPGPESKPEPTPALSEAAVAAEKLHELAKAAYLEGKRDQAIEYWREAHRLEPNWKYAYNLSNVLYEAGRPIDSWDFIRESERLGLPERFLAKLGEMRTKIQLELLQGHAYIQLDIDPADVVVTLDGEPFDPPFMRWTPHAQSHVIVSAEGYVTHEQELAHAIGQRYTFEIRLERAPASLVITGTPKGAKVRVDGKLVGTLPEAGPVLLTQGTHEVHASADGYRARSQKIQVEAGQAAHVTFELAKVDTGISLDTVGWIAGGVGAAALITGAALLFGADGIAADLNARNKDPIALGALTYDAYRAQYDQDESRYADLRTAGFVVSGVGGAAIVAAATMLLWPEARPPKPGKAHGPAGAPRPDVEPPALPLRAPDKDDGGVTPSAFFVTPLAGGAALCGGFTF